MIDAVGLEAHRMGPEGLYDKAKQAVRLETDRPHVLRQAILACRKGGTVSVPGVYGGFVDKVLMGSFMNKALTIKTGQTHVHRYLHTLLERVQNGKKGGLLSGFRIIWQSTTIIQVQENFLDWRWL